MISPDEGRIELKYALPADRRGELVRAALHHIPPDPHGGDLSCEPDLVWASGDPPPHGYRVHSTYLDLPTLDGYSRRLAEARIRNRIRIRTYGQGDGDAPVFLEAKRKLHERVVKHRVRLCRLSQWRTGPAEAPWRDAVAALEPGRARRLAERWTAAAEGPPAMIPVTATHYLREVFSQGNERLTIDHTVTASPGDDLRDLRAAGTTALIPADWLVLELKFDGNMPGWMRGLIREFRLVSEPISKFALGVVRTRRDSHPAELLRLTPPSMLEAGRGLTGAWPALDDQAAAR